MDADVEACPAVSSQIRNKPGIATHSVCSPIDFERALDALRAVVGTAFVCADGTSRADYGRTTLPSGTFPRVIVQPASAQEVQCVVRIAANFKLPVHPISCGRNWGYGDACAATDGQLLLDLKRMNRILEVNAALGYATIEPGVTQGQLADFIASHNLPLMLDATGAGPLASIVGNTLERGFGHTPHGDRFLHTCNMEIVLADGRMLKTGFGHFQNAQSAAVYKWGVGPYLDGLFTQSNLGIVTKLTFWLIPKPECFKAFIFTVRSPGDLGGLIEALRPLRMRGTLTTPIHIANDLRLISMSQSYPWEEMQGEIPLSPDVRARLRKRHGVQAWLGTGALYGSKAEVSAAASEVRKALRRVNGIKHVLFLSERRLRCAGWIVNAARAIGLGGAPSKLLSKITTAFELLKGKSPANCVQGGLWRVRNGVASPAIDSADPLDYRAGFMWLAPVLPMTKSHVDRVNNLLEPIFNRHGFDYLVTFSMVTARSLCAVTTIAFDKGNPEESARAKVCHDEALDKLLAAGYVPYRLGISSMHAIDRTSEVFFDVVRKIKAALDPDALLSPGHYEPSPARP